VRVDGAGDAGPACSLVAATSLASSATSATVAAGSVSGSPSSAGVRTLSWSVAPVSGDFAAACPTAPGEVSPPGAAIPLAVDRDGVTWEEAAASCSATFRVYRGDLDGLDGGDHGACVASDLVDPFHGDTSDPAPDTGFFYLASGVAGGVEGTSGTASDGTERNPTSCP
jgi:hypothetical protein